MSRSMLIATVGIAAYAVISTVAAAGVAVAWRRWRQVESWPPVERAARLARWRLLPSACGALLAGGVVIPIFAAFEPVRASEPVGPLLIACAAAGLLTIAAAMWVALQTGVSTYQVRRAWLRSATPLEIDPPAGVPTYMIDTMAPVVALIGVVSPRLVAARGVIEACSHNELAAIVAHERGHLVAHDNLKRWLLTCAPDTLRFTAIHREINDAWRNAAEDAADDLVTGGREQARVNLAALLVKVARLAAGAPVPATASPFADADGLERRVRRLLGTADSSATSPRRKPFMAAVVAIAAVAALALAGNLEPLYDIIELTVGFGR